MGSRLSGNRNEEEDEDGEEEEDEDEDLFSGPQKPAPKASSGGAGSTPAPPPKNFAELSAGAKKKKVPIAVENSAGAQFAKLAAAKKAAAAQAPKKSARAPKPEAAGVPAAAAAGEAPSDLAAEELPRGGEGARWLALEDCPVREGRDVKSAKRGVVQAGQECTQTGPWRAEPSGRVRMPVRAARGLEGWLTADARQCLASDGSRGALSLRLLAEAPEEAEDEDAAGQESAARATNEFEELLDMFGGSDAPEEEASAPPEDDGSGQEATADDPQELCDVAGPAEASEGATQPQEGGGVATSELTEAQKRLRNVRKKLRELAALEARTEPLTETQSQRLARKPELQREERLAAADVAAEQGLPAPKKRAKKPRKPAPKKGGSGGSASVSRRWWIVMFALLPGAVLLIAHYMIHT